MGNIILADLSIRLKRALRPCRRSAARTWIVAVVFFLIWTLLATRPLGWNLANTTYYAPGDNLLNAYILCWNYQALLHQPLSWFDASFYYPTPMALGLSENLIGLSLLFAPIHLILRDTLALANFTILFSFLSLALLAFGLVRHWTGSFWLGMLAGLLIAFAPPRYTQLGHLQLLNYQPLLLALFFLERWTRTGRVRDALGLFGCILVQFYVGIYLVVFLLVVLAVAGPVMFALRMRTIRWRAMLVHSVIAVPAMALLVWPVYRAYRYVRDVFGIHIPFAWLEKCGALWIDFLNVSSIFQCYKNTHTRFHNALSPIPWEHSIGMPYSFYLVAAVALVAGLILLARGRGDAHVRLPHRALFLACLLSGMLCVVLMFGPRPNGVEGALAELKLPYRYFFLHFPGFEGMRVPTRFSLPASVTLVFAVMLALGWVRRRWGRSGARWVDAALGLWFGWLLFAMWTSPLPLYPMPPRKALPPYVGHLADRPAEPLFLWPDTLETTGIASIYLYHNTYYWHPMVNGRSGHLPPVHGERYRALLNAFPSTASLDRLENLGVRRLVIVWEFLAPDRVGPMRKALAQWQAAGRIRPELVDDRSDVWWIEDQEAKD